MSRTIAAIVAVALFVSQVAHGSHIPYTAPETEIFQTEQKPILPHDSSNENALDGLVEIQQLDELKYQVASSWEPIVDEEPPGKESTPDRIKPLLM